MNEEDQIKKIIQDFSTDIAKQTVIDPQFVDSYRTEYDGRVATANDGSNFGKVSIEVRDTQVMAVLRDRPFPVCRLLDMVGTGTLTLSEKPPV